MSSDEELDLTGQILILALGLGLASPLFVRLFQNLSLYQGFLLVIGWWQACITGYLSYKIYVLTRADSRVPNLEIESEIELDTVGIEDTDWDTVWFKFKITNTSRGRAKITDIQAKEHLQKTARDKLEEDVIDRDNIFTTVEDYPLDLPTILDHRQDFDFTVIVNGAPYVDFVGLYIEEEKLGIIEEYRTIDNDHIRYFTDNERVPDFV
jgi:hypothetical protein